MPRIRNAHVIERLQVASRASGPVQVERRPASGLGDSSRRVSAATFDIIGRLGGLAQDLNQERLARRFVTDKQAGVDARSQELLQGGEAQREDALQKYRPAFRQGYLLTEGANRIAQAGTELTRKMAAMEPDEDPRAAIQETLEPLLQDKAFTDPAVRGQLLKSVEGLRQSAVETYHKNELAEMLERQQENLASLARIGIQDRSLWSQEGIDKFREQLNTEQFAYLSADEADNIVSTALSDLIEKGEIEPTEARTFLQDTKSNDGVSLWDRKDTNGNRWADRFDNSLTAGASVRRKAVEEKQADQQATMEKQWGDLAHRGGFSSPQINDAASKLGLVGQDRFTFVRHWESANRSGLERLRREAEEAAHRRKMLQAATMGKREDHTNAEWQKRAAEEWEAASRANDSGKKAAVIRTYTRMGIVIPQLRDMLNSPTARNMPRLKDLYENLAAVDSVVADRYLTDDNAALLMSYTRDIANGSNPQEAINNLPVGAKKAERREAAETVNRAYTQWSKAQPETLKDGTARPPWLAAEVRMRATQMLANFADLRPEIALETAEKQAIAGTEKINGVLVRPGSMQRGNAPLVTQHVLDVERELGDAVPSEFRGKLYAAPTAQDGNVFAVLTPTGFPLIDERTGDFIMFDPNEVANARRQYDAAKAAHELRVSSAEHNATGPRFMGIVPEAAAQARISVGSDPKTWVQTDDGPMAPGSPEGRKAANPFPDFATWAASRK